MFGRTSESIKAPNNDGVELSLKAQRTFMALGRIVRRIAKAKVSVGSIFLHTCPQTSTYKLFDDSRIEDLNPAVV
jgi:hypothetical protein